LSWFQSLVWWIRGFKSVPTRKELLEA